MTVRLFDRAKLLSAASRAISVSLSGIAGGAAIWITHFVAMLGFHLPFDNACIPRRLDVSAEP